MSPFFVCFVLLCFEISVILYQVLNEDFKLYFKKKTSIYSVMKHSVAFYLPFINIKRSRKLQGNLFLKFQMKHSNVEDG